MRDTIKEFIRIANIPRTSALAEACEDEAIRAQNLIDEIPPIVCLCGSTRFKQAFIDANRDETIKGNIVLSVGMFGHQEGLDMTGELKQRLDHLHKRKIDLCDEVFVLNVDGYVGESTASEVEYAEEIGKPIRWLIPCEREDQP